MGRPLKMRTSQETCQRIINFKLSGHEALSITSAEKLASICFLNILQAV